MRRVVLMGLWIEELSILLKQCILEILRNSLCSFFQEAHIS